MIEERTHDIQPQSEARVSKRYPIAARVSFQWRGADRLWCHGVGVTQDISAGGALILAHDLPPLGTEIEVTVVLPSVRQGATLEGRLRGSGTVVRVVSPGGFAAVVGFHILKADEQRNFKGICL